MGASTLIRASIEFALDDVRYHGRTLTILWDRDGKRYQRGAGLTVLVDGQRVAHTPGLERITGAMPARR